MKEENNNTMQVSKDILFYAFRYSLGRQTFAPTQVMEAIRNNISRISDHDIEQYIEEIEDQKRFGYGMECDKNEWLNFKQYLMTILQNRHKKLNI